MRQRLLLVDDEPRNLALLEAYLGPLGHELVHAGGGREALEALDVAPIDLILLDVMMPDLDGIDVLTHVRARPDGSYVPVILITGRTERDSRVRGLEAGADEFLEKPVDRAILLARVKTLLRLKQVNDEVAQRNDALERLQRAQRELTEFIVHDLKNPLAVVHMNLSYVRQQLGDKSPSITEGMVDAQDATSRMQKMIEDLLSIARLEQSELSLRPERIAVGGLLESVSRAHARDAEAKRIEVRVVADKDLGVQADLALLTRVVENLTTNAIHYTPAGGRVELAALRSADWITIAVSNTGRRLAEDDRGRIFEKFRRGKTAPSLPGHAGLGLYFCKRAVEAHGGSIALVESVDWPISFEVRLPNSIATAPSGSPAGDR